jgi:hypothetical protein
VALAKEESTVEESLVVGMKDFRKRLFAGAVGSITWTWTSGDQSSSGHFVTGSDDAPRITLRYRCRDVKDVRIPVRLTSTPTQFGGRRWWFVCPLTVRGMV